jgi:hypothetical protein
MPARARQPASNALSERDSDRVCIQPSSLMMFSDDVA